MAAVGAAKRWSHAKSPLGEIQTVANGAAHAVVIDPTDQALVYATLVDEVLQQTPNGIVGECRNDGSVEAKATLQSASHVILASTLRNFKVACSPNPSVPRVEAKHDLAQTDEVPAAI